MIDAHRRFVIAVLLLLASGAALPGPSCEEAGEIGTIRRLTVEEAIDLATSVSPRLGALRSLEQGAEAGLRGARAEALPQFDLTAGYTRYSDVPDWAISLPAPINFTHVIFPNIPDNYATRLGVWVPLYTGGRISKQIEAAEGERAAASMEVRSGTADVALETATSYWSLVTALAAEKVLREALAAYDAHLADARNRERFGLAARNELLAVRVERDRAELARIQSVSAAAVINADLVRLLDLPSTTRLEPADPLERGAPPEEDLETLVGAALESRPERAALRARIEAADARARGARADRLPQARFSAGYDYARPNKRIIPPEDRWEDTWDASVLLSFKVFDSGRTAASVAQREAQAAAARQQLEDLERRIRFEVTQRLLDLTTAEAAVTVAEQSLLSARENQRVAFERYGAGVIPSSELLDAEVALLRAGLGRTEELARLRLALARLDRAVGR